MYFSDLTEECPLTKEKDYKYRLCSCNGLRFIIICFVVLTAAITAMLVLQTFYTENISQVCIKETKHKVLIKYLNNILIFF